MEGTVRFVNQEKHYGFVQIEGEQSYFFHQDEVVGEPVTRGDAVTFQIDDDPRRPGESRAVGVQKIGSTFSPDPTRVFIANISYDAQEADLEALLSEFGEVRDVQICRDVQNGNSKGFGFATFGNPADAQVYVESLHGYEWRGRRLSIQPARSR